ncbi:MAG: OmpA family protein [candidate division WOR-3 bacterium]
MKQTAQFLTVLIAVLFLFVAVGCAKKVVKKEEPIPPPPVEEEKEMPPIERKPAELSLATIYFDFDRSDIRPGDAKILEENARILKENPDAKIMIEGHCCPIGTSEYNMALGWRRANSARDYLVKLGISKDRLSTISYGEERLVTTVEAEYWKNRRCEFKSQ